MENSIATRKNNFSQELEPIFEMLREKESIMSEMEWRTMVDSVKHRIMSAPDQYLSGQPKTDDALKSIIEYIFNERLN